MINLFDYLPEETFSRYFCITLLVVFAVLAAYVVVTLWFQVLFAILWKSAAENNGFAAVAFILLAAVTFAAVVAGGAGIIQRLFFA